MRTISGRRPSAGDKSARIAALGLTLLRLPIGVLLATAIASKSVEPASFFLLSFVTLDVFDGVMARHVGAEGPTRRALDGAVDRVVTDTCLLLGAAMFQPSLLALPIAIAIRDLATGAVNTYLMCNRLVVLEASGFHKLGSVAAAAFGLGLISGSAVAATLTGVVCTVISLALAFDYTRAQRAVILCDRRSPHLRIVATDAVEQPTAARTGSVRQAQLVRP